MKRSFQKRKCATASYTGGALKVLTAAPSPEGQTPSAHRLRLGLPGYLILFAPLALVFQCQQTSRKPPSPLVFLPISTHFTVTPGIPLSSPSLKQISFECSSLVKPRDFTFDLIHHLHALYTQSIRVTLATSVLPRLLARS